MPALLSDARCRTLCCSTGAMDTYDASHNVGGQNGSACCLLFPVFSDADILTSNTNLTQVPYAPGHNGCFVCNLVSPGLWSSTSCVRRPSVASVASQAARVSARVCVCDKPALSRPAHEGEGL